MTRDDNRGVRTLWGWGLGAEAQAAPVLVWVRASPASACPSLASPAHSVSPECLWLPLPRIVWVMAWGPTWATCPSQTHTTGAL